MSNKLTKEDIDILIKSYDIDKDNQLSDNELNNMINDLKLSNKEMSDEVKKILLKFDTNGDGIIDENEFNNLQHEITINNTVRIAGYTGVYARLFRYLAFTSDFGEALRPVVRTSIVNISYLISIGYCFADVGIEAYNLHERGYKSHDGKPMTMTQCIVERSVFQALASIVVPFGIIHSAVGVGKRIFNKIGRFQKFGPSIIGLSIIPLLPMYLDHPVEQAIEHVFANYGPWKPKEHEN